jgi:uncharacterized protein (DUF305 family)
MDVSTVRDLPDVRTSPADRLLILALVSGLAACATSAPPTPSEGATSLTELEALYRARQDSAFLDVSDADVAFMVGMIDHHAQALVMSQMAPRNDAGPAVRRLTSRILNAQRDEIALMQRWLRDRGQTVPEVDASGMVHMPGGDHATHMGMMPGMLSPAQLDELRAARGADFDRLFLRYMIQHHQGAVTMVHELFATDGAAQDELVFKIASDIQVDQTTEIERMQLMLDALSQAGRSP